MKVTLLFVLMKKCRASCQFLSAFHLSFMYFRIVHFVLNNDTHQKVNSHSLRNQHVSQPLNLDTKFQLHIDWLNVVVDISCIICET